MEKVCWLINNKTNYKTLACCCGHGKYPMTIVVTRGYGNPLEYFSQVEIPRERKFYKRDKQGILYIPEIKGEEREYIYAYDRKIKRRTVHFLREGNAISLISGRKFKYNPKEMNSIRKIINKLRALHR